MMYRRTVLAITTSILAGCSGFSNDARNDETSTQTTSTRRATTGTTDTSTTTQRSYALLSADPKSMTENEVRRDLADHDCSEFIEASSRCTDDDGRLDVSVSPTVGTLSDATVELTVENSTDEDFKTNHYRWVLQKWDGNRWRRIAPLAVPAPLDTIPAGKRHTHRIEPVERKVAHSQQAYVAESEITLGGLGPGVYGFATSGYFESTPDEELGTGVVFGLAGEAPPVRPTDDVTRVERDESTLVVRADAPSDRRGELVVSLSEAEAEVQLLPEHVHQLAALSNTLPYAPTEGVETVRYVGRADDVNLVGTYLSAVTPDDATRYGFRDYAFEVSVPDA